MNAITKDEVLEGLGSGDLVVVNVLKKEAYNRIHIRGSISIPRNELEAGRWQELDRGNAVVVPCSSFSCGASKLAADFLETKGYRVRAYEGGTKEWAEAGLPMDGMVSPKQYLEERYGGPARANPSQTA
ncbi:MAG: rhodanese-like domain-containing protein [Thaumarchaeota archaeon]|nr:rhodanese-like domain-containing protein [Nitrososphaerota archaeon]